MALEEATVTVSLKSLSKTFQTTKIIFDYRKSNGWRYCVSNSMKVKTLRPEPRPKRVWSPFKIPLTG